MNTGVRGVLPMYHIFGCASDFAHNFRHLMPTTLNCGATGCCNPYKNIISVFDGYMRDLVEFIIHSYL